MTSKNKNLSPSFFNKKNELWKKNNVTYAWVSHVDYRLYPEEYRVGKGEQGVLLCQPYKTEILSHWRFKTPEIAKISSEKIFDMFENYLANNDFVGADMARKYLQMGYTRARRYATHKGGRKYDITTGEELPRKTEDPLKAEGARMFYDKWKQAEENLTYKTLKKQWKIKRG